MADICMIMVESGYLDPEVPTLNSEEPSKLSLGPWLLIALEFRELR
jgi:hypothetical protein